MPRLNAPARKGFTIIELLVTILIIGTLLSIAIVALGNARAKSRDAKRVSDVQVIRAALEQYWLTQASYPAAALQQSLGTGSYAVLSSSGYETSPGTGTVYLTIPTGPTNGEYYLYQSTVSSGYAIRFTLERPTSNGPAGTYYAHSNSIDTDSSSK